MYVRLSRINLNGFDRLLLQMTIVSTLQKTKHRLINARTCVLDAVIWNDGKNSHSAVTVDNHVVKAQLIGTRVFTGLGLQHGRVERV